MRVLFRAGFDSYSGYGRDSVDLAIHLSKRVDVVPWPIELLPGLPQTFTDLLTKDPRGASAGTPFDVALCFTDPWRLDPTRWTDLAPKAVGYTMWESDRIRPQDMLPDLYGDVPTDGADWTPKTGPDRWYSDEPGDDGRKRALDLLLVTCPMNVAAFDHLDPHVPKAVVPCGIDPNAWPVLDRAMAHAHDPVVHFGAVGSFVPRKAIFTLLTAWKQLKEDVPGFDATLDVKDSSSRLHPLVADAYGPDLTIHHGVWDHTDLVGFYHYLDAMVSVSRGEGNDKPLMEMLATGGAVMGTDWSGHQTYLTPEVGWPLPGVLCPAKPGGEVLDFAVDVDALKETILHVWRSRQEASDRGGQGAWNIRESHSWPVIAARIEAHLAGVVAA